VERREGSRDAPEHQKSWQLLAPPGPKAMKAMCERISKVEYGKKGRKTPPEELLFKSHTLPHKIGRGRENFNRRECAQDKEDEESR